jgi:NCAIR mutase (PurE)-related proteins
VRDVLEDVAAGELTPAEAEAQLAGYITGEAGRFDAAREQRRGIPEGILAEGKTPTEITELASSALISTEHAVITRIDADTAETVISSLSAGESHTFDDRAQTLTIQTDEYSPPETDGTVGIVTGGTADTAVAGEAATVLKEMGVSIEWITDVGVAHLGRVIDHIDTLKQTDILIVAAGREGALPTVIAGLVDTPVIGLPVASGYGYDGDGEAALSGLLQSCTVLSVVNIDAGFVAGSQAGLIVRAIDDARKTLDE